MSVEIVLVKSPTGALLPADQQAVEFISKLKMGAGVRGKFVRQRNLVNHRRAFALFNLAFDTWEPVELTYKGQIVAKNFDRFRKDLTILAGFYEAVTNLRGEVRLEAKSLSFANMDENEFQLVYKAILNVVWEKVLCDSAKYKSPEEVDRVVQELLRFGS